MNPKDMSDDELRVAVATEVMGIEVLPDMRMPLKGPTQTVVLVSIPDYPRDWSAAGAVAEKLHDEGDGCIVTIESSWTEHAKPCWYCSIYRMGSCEEAETASAPTAPRAACEAAVLAVRAKGESE